jgi:CopG family nickel-responsive transcriptional regulator
MGIISISVDEQTIEEMSRVQKALELSGRSELVRAGIRILSTDLLDKDKLKGFVSCVLTVTHEEKDEETVTKIKHKFENIIKTHLHCKLRKENCLEIFVLEGDAENVKDMTKRFQLDEGMEHVKLIVT